MGQYPQKNGPEYDLLGTKLALKNKKVSVDMRECLRKTVTGFGEKGLARVVALSGNNLRGAKPKTPAANEERRRKFNIIAMLIMRAAQREGGDSQPTSSFPSQRASARAEEDHCKLRIMIRHIVVTMDEILFLGGTDLCIAINFIDTACGVYDDCKSCARATSTMGFGVLASARVEQNLMTKSSTESELEGSANYLPKV